MGPAAISSDPGLFSRQTDLAKPDAINLQAFLATLQVVVRFAVGKGLHPVNYVDIRVPVVAKLPDPPLCWARSRVISLGKGR